MANYQNNYTSNFEGQDPAGDAGLSLFVNGAEYSYRPSGSDATVYIPTVEKHAHDYANIVYAITRVLAAGGSPIVTKLGAEFIYASGDTSEYKFVNVSGDSITEMTIDRSTGTVTTQNNFLSGGAVYPSLQFAIADASHLSVGDIFETNGFHTSGDGGAARYVVSNTGTANGMDIVQLAAGKIATIQVTQECSPEQIGYATGTDVVPYVSRLIAIGIKTIRLIKTYTWKTTLTLTTRGIDFVGNIPFTQSPVTSLINVNLNQGLTNAIVLRAPNITFENLYFYNAKGSPSNETAVNCDWSSSDANNYMIKFKRVRFVSFNYGAYFHGTLPWHITFEDVVLGWCNYGIVFAANSSILSFKNVHTSGCYVCGINMRGATQGVAFTQCNFGSYSNALHFEKYGLGMNQEYTFTGCNFELDKLDLDGNTKNVFIDVDNDINVSLDFSGCNFVITKQAMQVIPANMRFIRLGNGSTLRMTACIIEDDLSGNAYLKQFLDESRTPFQETGSLSIDSTTKYFEVADALIPYVMRTGQAKGLVADGARTGSETAISDCNTWIPDYDGEVKVARVSTYEGTLNMPVASSFYGFLWTMGVISSPNIRIWQMLLGNDGRIYTRLGMDLGGGMTWSSWKTISNLPNGLLTFDSVADTNSSAIQVWGGDNTSPMGTYKTIGNISVPAGHIADISIAGSLQYNIQNNSVNTIVFQLSEQDAFDNGAVKQNVYVRGEGIVNEIPVSVRFVVRNTSSSTKTYYFGAYNIYSVPSGDIVELANDISATQGLRITLISYGVNNNA